MAIVLPPCADNPYGYLGGHHHLVFLVSGSLCGVYSRGSSFLIFLNNYSQRGNVVLDPMFASVSPKAGGWTKAFLVVVLMTGISFGDEF
jgi:hypothetical protein